MKFLEIVGNASTTAFKNGRRIGHNVNAAAYPDGGQVVIILESNGSKVRGVEHIHTTTEKYSAFCAAKTGRPLFVRAIELFDGVVVAL